ncbi:MAG: P1 family peptidase [Bifidobacterium adolescentis]
MLPSVIKIHSILHTVTEDENGKAARTGSWSGCSGNTRTLERDHRCAGRARSGVTTLIEGDGPLVPGKGPVRTGVTAILPRGHDDARLSRCWAGIYALNGNGEMTGSHWIKDAGYFVRPGLHHQHPVGRHASITLRPAG